MSKSSRSDVIRQMHRVLKKHFTAVAPPNDRTILEHILLACLLENARHEVAETCLARVQQLYYDWNEVRVTTVRELSEVFRDLPDPPAAAARLKGALQSVFETVYQFELEDLRKYKLGDAAGRLASLKGVTPFAVAYVVQNGLGGHAIPLCKGSLEACYLVGAASRAEIEKGTVPGLERAIPKSKGIEFASLLHSLGAEWILSPRSTKLRGILTDIAPDAGQRVAELLNAGQEPTASTDSTKTPRPSKKGATKRGEAKPKGPKKSKGEIPAKAKKTKPSDGTKPKKPAAKTSKSASKQLARRKPR